MRSITILTTLLLLAGSLPAQQVETLVAGPSTFNDGLALDAQGNIYASRYYSSTVTKIYRDGSNEIFADGFNDPNGIAFGPDGFLYVANATGGRIDRVSPQGDVSAAVTGLSNPSGVAFDSHGNMIIASYQQSRLWQYDTTDGLSSFMTGNELNGPVGLVFDAEDNLYIGNFNDGKVIKRTAAAVVSVIGDLPGQMGFLTLANGFIYATAFQNNRVYRINSDGSGQQLFAGSGTAGSTDGELLSARFDGPNGIAATASGDTLYISDYESRSLRMITGVNSSVSALKDNTARAGRYELQQNYPNPFNPQTLIQFHIPETGPVLLEVYNTLGQKVATLLDNSLAAGRHQAAFVADDLASGIYYYRLQAGAFAEVKKMVLLK